MIACFYCASGADCHKVFDAGYHGNNAAGICMLSIVILITQPFYMHYLYNMPYNSPCDVDIDVALLQYHHSLGCCREVLPLQKQHRIAVSSLVDMPKLQ